ncbi:DNA polymerase epsilon, subunit B [Neoconidiobolus thromboides FSU 785]|nr:DNA polymerase epsilon, subunit B [Neoconidiobolus thromboides FSU 785]
MRKRRQLKQFILFVIKSIIDIVSYLFIYFKVIFLTRILIILYLAGIQHLEYEHVKKIIEELNTTFELNEFGDPVIRPNINFDNTQEDNNNFTNFDKGNILDITKYFNVVNAFDMPLFYYSEEYKTFLQKPKENKLFLNANERAKIYQERYHLLKKKIMRSGKFITPSAFNTNKNGIQLLDIKSLIGRYNQHYCLFGMLLKRGENEYYLEDLESNVKLEFINNYKLNKGLFTTECFVLIEGEMGEDEIFSVKNLLLPPYESNEFSKNYNEVDWIDIHSNRIPTNTLSLLKEEFENVSFIFLSDIYLDQSTTFDGLNKLFMELENTEIPLAIIMMGSFNSSRILYNDLDTTQYKENFTKLGNLISKFEKISRWTKFVFIPGPNDPVYLYTLPIPALDSYFYGGLKNKVNQFLFTSNPTRITILDKELIFMRQNLMHKVLRNLAIPLPEKFTNSPELIQEMLYKTILANKHLSPLPINIQPILVAFDSALRLYNNPDLLVIADETSSYNTIYKDVICINPGSFSSIFNTSSFQYHLYKPILNLSETK